ncbi:CIC11C00000003576 [Sungouiella intermedia]|uniref:Plasma membrane fusion protein PRM1 n=1 Tax=Sungouiella intermedia TaxID=45354 RepID=A0A1L0BSJ7_9ASCO|nr:CIC11C00000003576 [[Candida] intermedia]
MRKYLTFNESLTQTWLSDLVVAMALLMVKVYLFTQTLLAAIASTEKATIYGCWKMNDMLDMVLNTQSQVNNVTREAVEYAMNSNVQIIKLLLTMSITVVKGVILLLIELYLGTLACLCTAFVHGTLEIITDTVSAITETVEDAINLATKGINTALERLSILINGFSASLTAIKSLFSLDDSSSVTDAINIVSLNVRSLSNITIPTTFVDTLRNLTDDIPDFETVLSNLTSMVTQPLDLLNNHVKQLSVNTTFELSSNGVQTFDVLKNTCLEIEASFQNVISRTRKCSDYILIGLAVGVFLSVCISIWIAHRNWQRKDVLLKLLACEQKQVQVGNLIFEHENILLHRLIKNWDPRLQWLVCYMSTPTVRRCFLIGSCGFLAYGLQSILLNYIETNLEPFMQSINMDETRSVLAHLVARSINETQVYVNETQDEINTGLLHPIQGVTTSIYSTILDAETAINNTVDSVFRSTPFAAPLQTVIYCTIGRKLDSIESGLGWLISNTQLKLTSFSDKNLHRISTTSVDSVYDSISDLGKLNTVGYLIKQYRKVLEVELLTSSSFIGVWLLMLAIGICILIYGHITEPDIQPQAIGVPRQLSHTQREALRFPYHDPFDLTASSRYTHV